MQHKQHLQGRLGLQSGELWEPLQHHILPHLNVTDLCRLGGTCKTLKRCIDGQAPSLWQAAAQDQLPRPHTSCSSREAACKLVGRYESASRNILTGATDHWQTREIQGDSWLKCEGLAYAPDGRALAVLVLKQRPSIANWWRGESCIAVYSLSSQLVAEIAVQQCPCFRWLCHAGQIAVAYSSGADTLACQIFQFQQGQVHLLEEHSFAFDHASVCQLSISSCGCFLSVSQARGGSDPDRLFIYRCSTSVTCFTSPICSTVQIVWSDSSPLAAVLCFSDPNIFDTAVDQLYLIDLSSLETTCMQLTGPVINSRWCGQQFMLHDANNLLVFDVGGRVLSCCPAVRPHAITAVFTTDGGKWATTHLSHSKVNCDWYISTLGTAVMTPPVCLSSAFGLATGVSFSPDGQFVILIALNKSQYDGLAAGQISYQSEIFEVEKGAQCCCISIPDKQTELVWGSDGCSLAYTQKNRVHITLFSDIRS